MCPQEEVLPPVVQQGAAGTQTSEVPSEPSATIAPGIAEAPNLAGAVEALLGLPKSQIEKLLSEWGESGSRLLLVLIHRLSAVEAQLADLKARVRKPVVPSTAGLAAGGTLPVHKDKELSAGKSELLEQIYRKNLLLRRMN